MNSFDYSCPTKVVFGLNKIADKFEKRANDLFNNS